jgi:hypothetical protein
MENEIKNIYNTLSGGKVISNDNYIISSKHFNSISTDRFISELKKRGVIWDGYDISFSELLNKDSQFTKKSNIEITNTLITSPTVSQIGIDIQEISELPDSVDYWEDEFYKSKFTPEEIAYCVVKDNPKQSFAGLYSCKEAIIKSDNNLNWQNINIEHDENGKPFYNNFNLSISHSGIYTIAIASKFDLEKLINNKNEKCETLIPLPIYKETSINNATSKNISIIILYVLIILTILFQFYIFFSK